MKGKQKIFGKIGKIGLALTIMLSMMLGNESLVLATTSMDVVLQEIKDGIQPIQINIQDTSIEKVSLFNHEETPIQEVLVVEGKAIVEANYNDDYIVKGISQEGNVVEEVKVEVNTLSHMLVTQIDKGKIQMSQFHPLAKSVEIQQNKVVLKTLTVDSKTLYYSGLDVNTSYQIVVKDDKGHVLKKEEQTYQYQSKEGLKGIEIKDVEGLLKIENNKEYYVSKDIEIPTHLQNKESVLGKKENIKIHGEGYTINNLVKPLFDEINGSEIDHLYMQGMINDEISTGTLANTIDKTTLNGVGVNVELTNTKAEYVGGLVGEAKDSTITNSFTTGKIEGNHIVSGLVGKSNGTIENVYSSVALISHTKASGLVGSNTGSIKNSYFSGTMKANETSYIAYHDNNGEGINCFYEENIQKVEGNWEKKEGVYPSLSKEYVNKQKEISSKMNAMSIQEGYVIKNNEVILNSDKDITWKKDNQVINNTLVLEDNEQIIQASQNKITTSYILPRSGAMSIALDDVSVGNTTTEKTTTISIQASGDAFYKVVKSGETAPTLSSIDYNTAKKEGWTQKGGSEGLLTLTGYAWNTSYDVYKAVAVGNVTKLSTVTTKKGTITGSITVSGKPYVGNTLSASITGNQNDKGKWVYEYASSMQASTWTTIANSNSHELTIDESLEGKYIRVRYEANTESEYAGSVISTPQYVQVEIKSVTLSGIAKNGEKLTANILPVEAEGSIDYQWFYEGEANILSRSKDYTLGQKDIGKKLYVKVLGKTGGMYTGEVTSVVSDTVITVKYDAPEGLLQGTTDESSMRVSIINGVGTYEIQYKEMGGEFSTSKSLITNDGTIMVTNLKANTTYIFRARRIASEGFFDSDWTEIQTGFKTTSPIVKGEMTITGKAIYKETLTATTTADNGNGKFIWYRDNSVIKEETSATFTSSYTLEKEDIGKQIRIEYVGSDGYDGKLVSYSEKIEKASATLPANTKATVSTIKDTSVDVTLPSNSESMSYQIGYGTSPNTPLEIFHGTFISNQRITLTGLQRNKEQYVFVRYSSNDEYKESEWSNASDAFTTLKTQVKDDITLSGTPQRDERLEITLNDNNHPTGTFRLYEVSGGNETEIDNFFPVEGKENTIYYDVPISTALGVTYKVTFSAKGDFEGTATKTSSGVIEASGVTPYEKPVAPELVKKTDTTFTVQVPKGKVGDYQFKYVDSANNETIITKSYKAQGQLTIDKLDRISTYEVYVKRLSDSADKTDSDYSDALTITTSKTPITGYMSISEQYPRSGNTITATYHKSLYIPTGDDTQGSSYKWYRVDPTSGNEILIANANSGSYTVTNADIGYKLKAVFNANETSFTGSKNISTNEVQGIKLPDTGVPKMEASNLSYADKIEMKISLSGRSDTWYQVREVSEDAPKAPKNGDEAITQKWTKFNADSVSLTTKYDGTKLKASTRYVVYTVNAANEKESSNVTRSNEAVSGLFMQSGTITMSGKTHVGETLTATLNNSNSSKGQWKWYYSDNAINLAAGNETPTFNNNNWVEIKDGYDKTLHQKTNALTVPDEAKGHFIKAVFSGSENDGYKGNVEYSTANTKPTGSYQQWVTKTYTEKFEVVGAAYEGKTVKVYLKGSDLLTTRSAGIQFYNRNPDGSTSAYKWNYGSIAIDPSTGYGELKFPSYDEMISLSWTNKAENPCYALYSGTPNKQIYRSNANGGAIGNYIYSDKYDLQYGYSISNSTDMKAFIEGTGKYTDRSKVYVITDNIDMSTLGVLTASSTTFSGTLNGDFHNIKGLSNPLFNNIAGADINNRAVIRNIVISNVNINAGRTAIISAGNTSNAILEKLLLYDANITTSNDAGMLITWATGGGVTLDSIGTAHGTFTQTVEDKSAGGIAVVFNQQTNVARNVFSVNSIMKLKASSAAGGLFRSMNNATVENSYAANQIVYDVGVTKGIGGISPAPSVSSNESEWAGIKNNFYDKTLFPVDPNIENPTKDGFVNGKRTDEMIGSKLKSKLDTNSEGVWTYKDGFYPRLTWTIDHGIEAANVYAATKGAFTSLDGQTTATEMFNGQIDGTIQIPSEFQKSGYEVVSSDSTILKVSKSGVITPLKAGDATITVTYTDSFGSKAIVDFAFTSRVSIKAFDNVSISGTTEVGKTLSASVTPSADASGATYKWYRRKIGTEGVGTAITGATSSTYKLTAADAGNDIRVEVSKSGYGTIVSSWSNEIIVGKPTSAPTISSVTDNSAIFTGTGSDMTSFEFAYAKSETGDKTIIPTKGNNVTVTGLARNTEYYAFARIPAGAGYAASEWSPAGTFTTEKTWISGTYTVSDERAVGQTIKFTFSNTNSQTLRWELRRIDGGNNYGYIRDFTQVDNNTITYTLKATEVGKVIFPQVFGTGDFTDNGNMKLFEGRPTVVKAKATTPSGAPTIVSNSATDSSVKVKYTTADTKQYEFGYAPYGSDDIQIVSGTYAGNTETTISGLNRNTRYRFFVREADSAGYTPSDWSNSSEATTKATALSGSMNVSGTAKVNETISFSVPNTNDQKGRWVLERRDDSNNLIATLTDFSEDASGQKITYQVTPEDADYKLKASLVGDGNFTGTISGETAVVAKAKYATPANSIFTVSKVSDTSMELTLSNVDGNYIIKYVDKSDGASKETSEVKGNTSVTISGLKRNQEYELSIKQSGGVGVVGYDDSDYSTTKLQKTNKTTLNGKVELTGDAKVASTLTAKYVKGSYTPTADDTNGTWKWYRGTQEISGETTNSYTVSEADKGYTIKAEYTILDSDANLTGSKSAMSEKVLKDAYSAPSEKIEGEAAIADTNKGSGLIIKNTKTTYFYKVGKANENAPSMPSRGQEVTSGWLKGTGSDITIDDLEANAAYKVYVFVGEDDSYGASSMVASESVITAKQVLSQPITLTGEIAVSSDMEASISEYGKAPEGTWKWYVADSKDASVWEVIDITGTNTSSATENKETVSIPLKYFNKYVKAIFIGTGDYQGSVEYISDTPLKGMPIMGSVSLDKESAEAFESITATYNGTDETSGSWIWYRDGVKIEETNYNRYGLSSTYIPVKEDINKKLKAVYSAENPLYEGSKEKEMTSSITKATQNTPDAPIVEKIEGNHVFMKNPINYRSEDSAPEVIFGYKKIGSSEARVWQTTPSTELILPEAYESYYIVARFKENDAFNQSAISATTVAKTESLRFEQTNLSITYDKTGVSATSIGNQIHGVYSGVGYDEGVWSVYNANGQVITKETGSIDIDTMTNTYSYVLSVDDLNSYITIRFEAKDNSSYGTDYVEMKTKQVVYKTESPYAPITPNILLQQATQMQVEIVSGQEYILQKGMEAPAINDLNWKEYSDSSYVYKNLDAGETYSVWTRVAETRDHAMSDMVSASLTTQGQLDFKNMIASSTRDGSVPKTSVDIVLPENIKNASSLHFTGSDGTLTNNGRVISITTSEANVQNFENADGNTNPNVYEKGSTWSNANFAYTLTFLDGSGNVIGTPLWNGGNIPSNAEKIRYTFYRGNAVTKGGTYDFHMDIKAISTDGEANVPVDVSITMQTQLQVVAPIQIELLTKDQKISNLREKPSITNENWMPVSVEIDEHITAGIGMPEASGILNKDLSQVTGQNELYLKMIGKTSSVENQEGVWFTSASGSQYQELMKLGAISSRNYYVYGYHSNQTTFPFNGGHNIDQAYKFTYRYSVNNTDIVKGSSE